MSVALPRPSRATRQGGAALAFVALLLVTSTLRADDDAPAQESADRRVVVLQSEGRGPIDPQLRREVDRLTLEAMTKRAGFERAYLSPVPFNDVELAAGCSGRDAGCLQRIAATLEADWLMVREIAREPSGRLYLTLVAHDGPSAIITRRAVAEIAKSGTQAVEQVVPLLVERLYPGRVPSAAATPVQEPPTPMLAKQAARDDRGPSPAKVVGWSSAAVGSALLVAGAVVGTLGRADAREHERLELGSMEAVDGAHDLFARAQRRTDIANALLIGGASAAAIGATALLWDYLRPKRDERVSLRVGPARGGVAVSLRASFRGGL